MKSFHTTPKAIAEDGDFQHASNNCEAKLLRPVASQATEGVYSRQWTATYSRIETSVPDKASGNGRLSESDKATLIYYTS